MNPKRIILSGAGLIVLGLALWIGLDPGAWQNWLGFSQAAYFKNGQNYAFYSGIGPMLLTATGMSTIIVGLWHNVNCHAEGCLYIGRHKINGTPWCNLHQDLGRQQVTTDDLLRAILAEMKDIRGHLATHE